MNPTDLANIDHFIKKVGISVAARSQVKIWKVADGREWRALDVFIGGLLHSISWAGGSATTEQILEYLRIRSAENPCLHPVNPV